MFGPSAAAFSTRILAAFLLLALASCGDNDIKLPHIYGDEIPPEVLDQPRVVPSPPKTTGEPEWPLVGKVPPLPKDFTPQPTIEAAKKQMENDRDDGLSLQQNYQSTPPVLPVAP